MIRALLSTLRDDRGMSAVEFALVLPILVTLSVGTVEYSRLIMLTQKLQSGSFILADLTARNKELSTEKLGHIFLAIDQVIRPFPFDEAGTSIVTSVGTDADGDPEVAWQCFGAGTLEADSQIGAGAGEAATLPENLAIESGEIIIAAEVFYAYEPLFGLGPAARVIRRTAYFKPRLGDLSTIAGCPA
jgi:TadE-like protein